MSVFSAKTGFSSILKSYSPADREKAKTSIINKVRFETPKLKGLNQAVKTVCDEGDYQQLNEFIAYLSEVELSNTEFSGVINDARKVAHKLSPKFTTLVESLLALNWTQRHAEAVQAYSDFFVDLMVAHSKYIHFGISKLIALWIPRCTDELLWTNGTPTADKRNELQAIHNLLERMLNTIPMTFDVVLVTVESMFPYFKKASHVVAGYMYNVLWLMQYKPIFMEFVVQLLLGKMIIMDVNAPRNEIEESEYDECDEVEIDSMNEAEEKIFEMDDCQQESTKQPMNHPIAHTLDICMELFFEFLDAKNPLNCSNLNEQEKQLHQMRSTQFFKALMLAFENVILPSHNTHHVQFLVFYYCSLKNTLAEQFLTLLWNKVKDPNVSAIVRQAAVSYMASFLARSKFIPLTTLKFYLKELCDWTHQYIQRADQYRANSSLKANLVFFSVCQAIFYVIAFRSRDLTADRKILLFLQSLRLSAMVNCNLNPLRVCLPAVATAFAGVTRAYQLAYCHAILERNARRKLATVYVNETTTPEETLETFFPFDPYLLKLSGVRIVPHYLKYQASEAEEHHHSGPTTHTNELKMQRKRGDSEMIEDVDVDDFLITDKRQKLAEFTFGSSPSFNT